MKYICSHKYAFVLIKTNHNIAKIVIKWKYKKTGTGKLLLSFVIALLNRDNFLFTYIKFLYTKGVSSCVNAIGLLCHMARKKAI